MSGSAYAGSSLYCQWISSSGTVLLSGDYRTFSYNPAVKLIDCTGYEDRFQYFLPGIRGGDISYSGVLPAGGPAGGTSNWGALAEGISGTLIVAPEGTGTGKPKKIIPSISSGVTWNSPYNNTVEYSISFSQIGERIDEVY